MKNGNAYFLFIVISIISSTSLSFAEKFYPTTAEIKAISQNLASSYPSIVSYHELAYASKDSTEPVIALKISDNVTSTEDEPVWVFSGVIHGREALGYKTLEMLAETLTKGYANNSQVAQWVNAYEIWLVMSGNPVGYKDNLRKNASNTSNRYTSGVDLNRNWDFRWGEGGNTSPDSNYFRGISPASENEVNSLQTLYLQYQPVYGVTFHQGNEPDGGQIMRPWSSSAAAPPDSQKLSSQAILLAEWVFNARQQGPLCQSNGSGGKVLEDPDGQSCSSATTPGYCKDLCWKPTQTTLGAYGQSSNAQYAKSGAIDLTVEMTDRLFNEAFLHNNTGPVNARQRAILAINKEVAGNWHDAIKTWFSSALPSDPQRFIAGSGITGHVVDSTTGAVIEAQVSVQGYTSSLIATRKSNATFGRFHRFLPVGNHVVTVSAANYITQAQNIQVSNDGMLTYKKIALVADGSQGPAGQRLENAVPVDVSANAGEKKAFYLEVPAGASNLNIAIRGGTGDADLYVRFGEKPTLNQYDCRPYLDGSTESCPITSAKKGVYYIMLNGYSTFTAVTLEGTYNIQ